MLRPSRRKRIPRRSSSCCTVGAAGAFGVFDLECATRFRFIVGLLRNGNGLRRLADLDAERSIGGGNAEVLVAEATDQIEGLLRRFLLREPQRVLLHLRFDRGPHVSRSAKEAVRGHGAVDALMRPLEIVVLHEQRDALLAILEVCEHRLAQELLPQRLPEPLDLPERLRMLRSTLAVADAASTEKLLELGLAAPGGILPALVGQDLARLAVLGDATLQSLDHQARLLVVRHRPRHQVARVVVHECDDVHAVIATQLEREQVGLPELIWLRALEPPGRLRPRRLVRLRFEQPGFVQDAPHRRLGHAQSLEAREYVPNAAGAPFGMFDSCCDHLGHGRGGGAPVRSRSGSRRPALADAKCIRAPRVEQLLELLHGPQ